MFNLYIIYLNVNLIYVDKYWTLCYIIYMKKNKYAQALGRLSSKKTREKMGEEEYLKQMKIRQSNGGKNRWKNRPKIEEIDTIEQSVL